MTDRTITTVNPATETELARYERMNDDQMFEALKACHDAFDEWRLTPATRRAEIIARIGQQLSSRKEELAQLMTDEVGKLIGDSRDEVDLCAAICEWTAKQGPEVLADEHRSLQDGRQGIITYSPIGVIYGIQPWNFPAYQVVRYAIANLMAGNGVLLKHAESVTGSGLMLEKIFRDAGLPENLFSVLRITHDQSDKVIDHKLVRGVTLTGSASAGQIIAKKAGEKLKKTTDQLLDAAITLHHVAYTIKFQVRQL